MAVRKATVGFAEEPELGNKGMVITAKKDDEILGHLMIGKASLHWFEKSAKKRANKVSWDDLIAFMQRQRVVKTTRP